jgi:hypothetical protein
MTRPPYLTEDPRNRDFWALSPEGQTRLDEPRFSPRLRRNLRRRSPTGRTPSRRADTTGRNRTPAMRLDSRRWWFRQLPRDPGIGDRCRRGRGLPEQPEGQVGVGQPQPAAFVPFPVSA